MLCTVCGLQGSYSCSACASSSHPIRYCSKRHQQVDWKVHKHVCGKPKELITDSDVVGIDLITDVDTEVLQHHKRNFTFAEYDIGIEEEDLQGEERNDDGSDEDDDKSDIRKALKSSKINPDTIIWEDAGKI